MWKKVTARAVAQTPGACIARISSELAPSKLIGSSLEDTQHPPLPGTWDTQVHRSGTLLYRGDALPGDSGCRCVPGHGHCNSLINDIMHLSIPISPPMYHGAAQKKPPV